MPLSPPTASSSPAWLRTRAEAAWAQFQSLPLPGLKDENWRYSSAKAVPLDDLKAAEVPDAAVVAACVEASAPLEGRSARLVFVNEVLAHSEVSGLPAGVLCLPLAEALEKCGDLVEQHFMQRKMQLGSEKFAALHLAMVTAGTVIFVPRGVTVPGPIEIFHWVSGAGAAIFPHTLVVAEENASVTVVDHYHSAKREAGFCCAVTDIVGKPGCHVTSVVCQELAEEAQSMHMTSTVAEKDAQMKSFQLQIGASWSRSENVSDLVGQGARSDMLSVSLPLGTQVVDQRTLQNHKAPGATSDLLYKNALYDTSRTVFSGLITVDEGAHQTDAYQTCRNLLNSETAEANSLPGLEINADQVRCSHGSTSSPVSPEELFYLMARGIPNIEARRLIVLGFADDAIQRIGNDQIEAMLHARVEEKFARVVAA
jgi:Fe-S cluster assembly protein SufD